MLAASSEATVQSKEEPKPQVKAEAEPDAQPSFKGLLLFTLKGVISTRPSSAVREQNAPVPSRQGLDPDLHLSLS